MITLSLCLANGHIDEATMRDLRGIQEQPLVIKHGDERPLYHGWIELWGTASLMNVFLHQHERYGFVHGVHPRMCVFELAK